MIYVCFVVAGAHKRGQIVITVRNPRKPITGILKGQSAVLAVLYWDYYIYIANFKGQVKYDLFSRKDIALAFYESSRIFGDKKK